MHDVIVLVRTQGEDVDWSRKDEFMVLIGMPVEDRDHIKLGIGVVEW